MPFKASFRHEYWTSDVRYVNDSVPDTGQAYVVAILASAVTLSQDTNAYLSVLHAAIVTDGGGSSAPTEPRPSTQRWASAKKR